MREFFLEVHYYRGTDGAIYELGSLIDLIMARGYSEAEAIEMAQDEVDGWVKDHEVYQHGEGSEGR